ncbi:hypothetical protein SEA_HOLLOW_74 [Gordonia phage Hollow]|nr:hypothetical protein SEA_HOLLOW_74 [Gordonia phage Hollow]
MIKRIALGFAAGALAFAAPAMALASPTPAPEYVSVGCTISTPTGPAPCPPPIVSTNGDSIGGGANSDPVNMGDLPRTGPDYTYEEPTYFDDPEPEAPAEPEAPVED